MKEHASAASRANETPGQARGDTKEGTDRTPRLSIIVPVYNAERFLPACLESIAAQTFRDFECILVDDGTPDSSGAICDAWAAQDARFRVIHQANAGVSAARNAGLDAARGEWVAFVDSDDMIEAVMYEELLAAADREKADLIVCGCLDDFGNRTRDDTAFWKDKRFPLTKINIIKYYKLGGEKAVWNKIARKSLYTEHSIRFPVGIKRNEDIYVTFFLAFYAKKIVTINKPFYRYNRQNVFSVTHTKGVSQKYIDDHTFVTDAIVSLYRTDSTIPEDAIRSFVEFRKVEYKTENLADPGRFRAVYPECNKIRYARYVRGLSAKVWYALCALHLERTAFALRRLKHRLQGRTPKAQAQ